MSAAREPHGKCLTHAGNEVPGRGSLAPETRQFRQFLNRPRDRLDHPDNDPSASDKNRPIAHGVKKSNKNHKE